MATIGNVHFCSRVVCAGILMAAGVTVATDRGSAQSAKRSGAGGASREIVLRAVVRPFCKLSKMHHGIRLHGRTDAGADIDSSVTRDGGFTVVCNKPYAMNLERTAVWGAPDFRPKLRRAAIDDPFGLERDPAPVFGNSDLFLERRQVATADAGEAFALARVAPDPELVRREVDEQDMGERDLEVVLSVDLSEGPLQSSCVMAAVTSASSFVCHAFSGTDGARLPLPRMEARVAVSGAEAAGPLLASAGPDSGTPSLISFPGSGVTAVSAHEAQSMAGLDSVVRRRRTSDRLTISVTAKY